MSQTDSFLSENPKTKHRLCKMIRKFTNILKPPVVTPFIKLIERGNAGIITLDRTDVFNAFNYEMVM